MVANVMTSIHVFITNLGPQYIIFSVIMAKNLLIDRMCFIQTQSEPIVWRRVYLLDKLEPGV